MYRFLAIAFIFLFMGCTTNTVIVNDVEEREANEIIVFLSGRGINARKIPIKSAGGAGETSAPLYGISVPMGDMTQAMAILNQNGLPRKKGTNLLELFAKQGLMTSEKEESIRYQAGLEQQLANTIRKIDGVIDADVQLSFPADSTASQGTPPTQHITAAVYVKHQGIVDDPNSHLISKIKRLVAASIYGLDINDVTVIADRSRFSEALSGVPDAGASSLKEYTTIWSIMIAQSSVTRFQWFFLSLIAIAAVSLLIATWIIWKFYPLLKDQGGIKSLFHPLPFMKKDESVFEEEEK